MFISSVTRGQLREAILRIREGQKDCRHIFNPTIPNALPDGAAAKVCGACGTVERVPAFTPASREVELNGAHASVGTLYG